MASELFWREYLQAASQCLDLVLDKARTQESSSAARQLLQLVSLPDQLWNAELPDCSCAAGTTLLAAFHAYISRISSQEVVTLGVQPSQLLGRVAATQQQAPLVPLCCPPVQTQETLGSHAQQLQQQLQQLLPHSQMSLLDICTAAGIQPASSMQHPLFQAGVVVASTTAAAAETAAGLDLALVLVPPTGSQAASGQVYLLYNSGLFTQEGAELMAQHFQVYLRVLLAGVSSQPLRTAPLMDAAEQQLVLCDFNATDLEYDRQAFVHGLFMQRAKQAPNAPCVVFEDYVFTYAEIDAASNRIANYLIEEAGVTPDSIVAVLLLRSPLMIATLLGVLKAGAGYLPLDHHHPEARIAFMLEDAAIKAVVVQPGLVQKLPDAASLSSLKIHTLLLHPKMEFKTTGKRPKVTRGAAFPPVVPATLAPSSFGAAAASSPDWNRGQLGTPATTCYIIYTSGSTGKPKGVVVMHQGLTAYTAWFRAYFGITAADVFLQKTPTNFDASMDELWMSLTAGAQLVVAAPEAHRDVHSVMMLITRHGVTTSSAVPSQLQALAREILALHGPEAAAAGQASCSSLKQVLSGGEALTTTMALDISTAMPRCRLFNTYGPTETTVGITAWLYQPSETQQAAPVAATIPIGNGIYNARLYVLDSGLQPVPVGVPGELYISGVQVAWGYLNRPDLNEKTFVPNPYCEGPGTYTDRMYKAGDLVRWLPGRHACLEFLGRVDHQVKLRGFRIELQEIEAALGALPGVSQVAAALAKNPTTQQDQLVAWVSPEGLDTQDLVTQLQGSLPEYMIPTVVVSMQHLPLLPSEKVNRKALPAPDFTRDAVRPQVKAAAAGAWASGDAAGSSSCPSSSTLSDRSSSSSPMASRSSSPSPRADPLMVYISEVWADVLGISNDSIGHLSDFFALGGNSLLCGKMNSRIRSGLNVPGLSGMLIYQNTSLAEFAQAVAVAGAVLPASYSCLTVTTASSGSSSRPDSCTSTDDLGSPGQLSTGLSDLQHYIAEAWADALGIEVGTLAAEDDFFARGGNSLLCGKMNSSIRSGLNLPSMSGMLIYQHPTLGAFTEAVAATGATIPAAFRISNSSSSSMGASGSASSSDILSGPVDPIMEGDALQDFIAAAWAETLGVQVSILAGQSDFFGLGGNSLLCGKMNSRLRVGLNLPGLSGMLIYQNTTLAEFTHAVAQAGPSLPCAGSSYSGSSRAMKGSYDGIFVSNGSSFRIAVPPGISRCPSGTSTASSLSGFTGSWTSGYSSYSNGHGNRSAGQGGMASTTANAAACAAAAAFVQDHPLPPGGDWAVDGYQQSLAAASKAAYTAANAAFSTVMSTLGLDAGYDTASSSKEALDLSSAVFNKHFRLGAGAAGGSAIPVYDARLQGLPSVPSFVYPAAGGKGSFKPALLKRELPGEEEEAAPVDQVQPSLALCTLIQIVGAAFISGTMYGLTVLPMLGWMWLLAMWGFQAIPLLPLLNLLVVALGLSLAVMGKWLCIGRYKEGEHPIWGWNYIRHWLGQQFVAAARNSYLPLIKRTTLVNWFYRALGMKVGKNVMIDTDDFLGHDLIQIKDDAVLDMFCGVSAITFEAGKPSDRFPGGKMTIKRASVGAGAVVGAHGMVVCSAVSDGGVVQPCTASNNPPAAWKGTQWPQTGPDAVIAVKSQDRPLGVLSGILAMFITDELLAIVSYPIMFGMLLFWTWLSGYSRDQLPYAAADTLVCFTHMPGNPLTAEAAAKCNNLMTAAIKSMILYPAAIFVVGQLLVLAAIPIKWLVRGRLKPDLALSLKPAPKTWGDRFRSHLLQVILDHPAMKMYLYMWTGTAMFNAWLRAMGSKVGKQAWIGEGLQLFEHDLVEIGDCVSVCSEVSMLPSTVMGARKIIIKGGSDVTNQTCLYPGVTVMPGACLGVFTYAEPERTFIRDSIVQGPVVLRPGRPEPEEGGPAVKEDPVVTRQVSSWQYFKFNTFYTIIMMVLLPLTVQLSTLPFYIASTILVFRFGLLWGALLVPASWGVDLAMDILWMMAVKKVLLRRCQGNNPFYHYTHTAWMITGILFYFHQLGVLKTISGSQMAVWYYRAMGAKIGKGVLLNSLASNEPDCLTIGDGTVIDDLSFVMAHTTENRCVKFHDVYIGSRVTIGCGSAVMPGCVVNDDAVIGDVSIVMKGETIPAGATWRGVPAVPIIDQA